MEPIHMKSVLNSLNEWGYLFSEEPPNAFLVLDGGDPRWPGSKPSSKLQQEQASRGELQHPVAYEGERSSLGCDVPNQRVFLFVEG